MPNPRCKCGACYGGQGGRMLIEKRCRVCWAIREARRPDTVFSYIVCSPGGMCRRDHSAVRVCRNA